MKCMKIKSLSLVLAFVLLCSVIPFNIKVSAAQSLPQFSMEEIIDQYQDQLREARAAFDTETSSKSRQADSNLQLAKDSAKAQAISLLTSAGYNAYDVNPSSFYDVEDILQTDLESIGLNPNCSYIAIISVEDIGVIGSRGAGSSFNYTYNGTTYSLRYLTITAADDLYYGKASSTSVLNSGVTTIIDNCLNTAIDLYIGAIYSPLSIVKSICGLNISMFGSSQPSTLSLNAGTNLTRIYTQIWSTSAWLSGSCVESYNCNSYMSGQYYSASQNKYVAVPTNSVGTAIYGDKYYDTTWKCQTAILTGGYYCNYDSSLSQSVKYYYGGSAKITHTFNV